MRILCDENVKRSIVQLLEQEGYQVNRVQDELTLGFEDSEIIEYCRANSLVLLTNDDDFFGFESHTGIFFLHDQHAPTRNVVTAIQRIIRYADTEDFENEVWHVPDGWA